jgi:glutaminyl-tRNA synthetase
MTKPRDPHEEAADDRGGNFIEEIVDHDLEQDKHGGRVVTRFPPEPNGYLHIGHAKSIVLNFAMAAKSPKGYCNLRFDDTNPTTESTEYVESIKRDIQWLGYDWGEREYYASDYFETLYEWAEFLVRQGKAYVDSQTEEQIRENRGNYYREGVDSPYRERPAEESLDLLRRMRAGEFDEGAHVLRAKIDMQSKDLNLRDPLMYRIRKTAHHRTGDTWFIYPMYDWAHGQSDAIEGVTHSLCSLEFQHHRPLYEWFLDALEIPHDKQPRQIEFARLNLTYTVLSKRKLQELVQQGYVDGWDDPRMPTLCGMRRRGYPPGAIRRFCERIGVSKRDTVIDVGLLESAVRDELNATAPRVMGVLRPLRLVIENYPEGEVEWFESQINPEQPELGTRKVPFSRVLYVDQNDFMEDPPKKWFRLAPGREVRLRSACLVTCNEVIKNDEGEVVELRCTWDPDSRGGAPADGRKVKGTLHWVSAEHAVDAEVRLYDRLFQTENPVAEAQEDYKEHLNPESREVLRGCKLEPSAAQFEPGARMQFERVGYFCVDSESTEDRPVFNRAITLRDTWAKIRQKQQQNG